jgi:hypothetical protein
MRRRRQIVYLGWQGFQNFGDDLLHETWKSALADPLDIQAPLTRRAYAESAPRILRHRMRLIGTERIVLLGGGTTIGFDNWAKHARRSLFCFGAQGLVIAGAGAAASHDRFALRLQTANWRAWQSMPGIVLCGVRGPLTQQECGRHWKPTAVVGDPALVYPLYVRMRPARHEARPVIGVCLGASPRSRFDVTAVAEAVAAYHAANPDAVVRVLQLAHEDADVARDLASRLHAATVVFGGDVRAMMETIAECSVLLSERLHGAVAGVSCGVPTVPLAYATKCDDFWLSVTGEVPVLRVGATKDQIVTELHRATDPVWTAVVSRRVRTLQQHLQHIVDVVRQWKDGRTTTQELFVLSGRLYFPGHPVEASESGTTDLPLRVASRVVASEEDSRRPEERNRTEGRLKDDSQYGDDGHSGHQQHA